ncbi:MAG TPA: hypothetical protein VFK80_11045 [Limnochordia bacterium]|nr:hypothetical protein [Limnochordia bacterium]
MKYGWEVQFILPQSAVSVEALKAALAKMGDSVVVTAALGLLKAHVHTPDPDAVVAYAKRLGEPQQLQVVNLDEA